MGFLLGKNAKAYIGTTVSTGVTETLIETAINAATEATKVKDLQTNLQKDTAEISDRSNAAGFKTKVATLKDGTVTFEMNWDTADTVFGMIKNAFLNDTEIFGAFLDQAKTVSGAAGAQGVAGNWQVANFTRKEPLLGALSVDVELIPSSQTAWYTNAV
jgi:hypothetical protein